MSSIGGQSNSESAKKPGERQAVEVIDLTCSSNSSNSRSSNEENRNDNDGTRKIAAAPSSSIKKAAATNTSVKRTASAGQHPGDPGTRMKNHKSNHCPPPRRVSPVLDSSTETAASNSHHENPPPRLVLKDDKAVVCYGILPLLRQLQPHFVAKSSTLQHIQQNDKFSCGFRNLQMLLSALVPSLRSNHPYFQFLQHIYNDKDVASLILATTANNNNNNNVLVLPSLVQVQEQLEQSWNAGFDQKGAHHFQYSVVGRPSKIGAVEVSSLLGYWCIDSCVIQFIKCSASRMCLPAFCYHYFSSSSSSSRSQPSTTNTTTTHASAEALAGVKWAETYSKMPPRHYSLFQHEQQQHEQQQEDLLPLYLQWPGHSVTVIGVELPPSTTILQHWNQLNLLVLDPLRNGSNMKQGLTKRGNNSSSNDNLATLRLSCQALTSKDCQLVLLGGTTTPLTESQRGERKEDIAVVTAAKHDVSKYYA